MTDFFNPRPKPPKMTDAEKDKLNHEVRARAGGKCEKCGRWCLVGGEVVFESDVHHIETRGAHGDEAWKIDNMILLCRWCHGAENAPKWGVR